MMMTPRLRKFALTTHVVASVGWLGAVAGFLAIAIASLTSRDAATARTMSPAMELTVWFIIVPFAFTSLGTGLVTGLGTPWGLFRYWWVVVKFLINVFCVIVLLKYLQSMNAMADMAGMGGESVGHASGALGFLLVATVLSVYKPRGITRYGWRKQRQERQTRAANRARGIAQERENDDVYTPTLT